MKKCRLDTPSLYDHDLLVHAYNFSSVRFITRLGVEWTQLSTTELRPKMGRAPLYKVRPISRSKPHMSSFSSTLAPACSQRRE
jgi:hypothetical protein